MRFISQLYHDAISNQPHDPDLPEIIFDTFKRETINTYHRDENHPYLQQLDLFTELLEKHDRTAQLLGRKPLGDFMQYASTINARAHYASIHLPYIEKNIIGLDAKGDSFQNLTDIVFCHPTFHKYVSDRFDECAAIEILSKRENPDRDKLCTLLHYRTILTAFSISDSGIPASQQHQYVRHLLDEGFVAASGLICETQYYSKDTIMRCNSDVLGRFGRYSYLTHDDQGNEIEVRANLASVKNTKDYLEGTPSLEVLSIDAAADLILDIALWLRQDQQWHQNHYWAQFPQQMAKLQEIEAMARLGETHH